MGNCWPSVSCLARQTIKVEAFFQCWFVTSLQTTQPKANQKTHANQLISDKCCSLLLLFLFVSPCLFFQFFLPVVVFPWSVYISCGSQVKEKISGKGAYLLPQITEETVIAYPLLVHTSHVTYWASNHRIIVVIENFVAGQRLRYTQRELAHNKPRQYLQPSHIYMRPTLSVLCGLPSQNKTLKAVCMYLTTCRLSWDTENACKERLRHACCTSPTGSCIWPWLWLLLFYPWAWRQVPRQGLSKKLQLNCALFCNVKNNTVHPFILPSSPIYRSSIRLFYSPQGPSSWLLWVPKCTRSNYCLYYY